MTFEIQPTAPTQTFNVISVGSLASIDDLYRTISAPILKYLRSLREGIALPLRWDLSSIRLGSRHGNRNWLDLATLTAWISVAEMISQFTPQTPSITLHPDPRLLAFLDRVGFFRILRTRAIVEIPPGMMVGYIRPRFDQPNRDHDAPAQIIMFARPHNIPTSDDLPKWTQWKDSERERLKFEVHRDIDRAVHYKREPTLHSVKLKAELLNVLPELVLNSWMWGESSAFVAVQRTAGHMTFAVCDAGCGFRRSMHKQAESGRRSNIADVKTEMDALRLGCIDNHDKYALRGALNMVLQSPEWSGWAKVSSLNAAISFEASLWYSLSKLLAQRRGGSVSMSTIRKMYGEVVEGSLDVIHKAKGYSRNWGSLSLPGVRVTFELTPNERR